MTAKLQQALNASKWTRWGALFLVSVIMLFGYMATDIVSPLEDLLVKHHNWSSTDYGFYSGAYGFINVFLLMLFFGGIILDKLGIRFTGTASASLMLIGTVIQYFAFSMQHGEATIMGMDVQIAIAALGFAIYGVGAEITGITVTKIIAKWFTGYELAFAMGFQVAVARIGTALALSYSLPIAQHYNSISRPLLLCVVALAAGLLCYFVYCVMDKKLDASQNDENKVSSDDEHFELKDLKVVFKNKGFWLITILCVTFYSAVFPFLKFATKLMIYKYGVDDSLAGSIPAILPFGTIIATPIFGMIYDKIGKGATLMIIGSILLAIVHIAFALPVLNEKWFAVAIMVVLGIAFSLVPSAMWPSVPKIIPMKLLGSAYALMFYVQNIGLTLVPILIGWILDSYSKQVDTTGAITYDYTIPMCVFASFGFCSIIVSLLLKISDKKDNYGLEQK